MALDPARNCRIKFRGASDNHLPLYRQQEIFARMGADFPESTLFGWVKTGPAWIRLPEDGLKK